MKKSLFILIFSILFTLTVAAQGTSNNPKKTDESKWSTMTYENVPIVKILDSKDAFVVLYQKHRIGVGKVVIPKTWAKGNPESPRKLKFRKVTNPNNAYLTVVKKDGQFFRVIINTTMNKKDSIWGVVDYRVPVDGADKETLEELDY